MTFRPDKIEDFKKIFEESQHLIRRFEGCRHVELLQQSDAPHIMYTFSLWDSEEHLDFYRQSKLFQNTWARTKVLFADKPQAWSMVSVI